MIRETETVVLSLTEVALQLLHSCEELGCYLQFENGLFLF